MVRLVISDIAEIASLGAFLTAVVIFAQFLGGAA
jgi:hypothetical protein